MVNLEPEPSVALTQNYVSTSNLADCLTFLKYKQEQISGLSTSKLTKAQFYDSFVNNLSDLIKLEDYLPSKEENNSSAVFSCKNQSDAEEFSFNFEC